MTDLAYRVLVTVLFLAIGGGIAAVTWPEWHHDHDHDEQTEDEP